MIFSEGITESARNASVRNGVAPVQPSVAAGLVGREALRDHLGERRVGEEAGDRKRALGEHAAVRRPTTMPPPISARCVDGERHVLVAHADDDEVVRVVCDRRGERAAAAGRSRATKPSPIRPVARWRSTTAIFARSARGVRDRVAVHDDRLALERPVTT